MHTALSATGLLFVGFLLACAQPERQVPPPSDSPKPAVETPAPSPTPQRPSTPPPSKIGQIPLFDPLVAEGRCRVQGETSRSVFYETDYPKRTIRIDVGSAARAFAPSVARITSTRTIGPEQEERESIYARFTAEGSIEFGERQYLTTGIGAMSERQRLLPADTSAVKDLALQVLQRCNK